MSSINKINTDILNEIIVGRVDPHIYAFSTETIPNYLKVGDTYRLVETRLNEWRVHFPNLEKQFSDIAKVDEETFFRDYAVHYFLESNNKTRLEKDPNSTHYYSNEFFKDTHRHDVEEAIKDIKKSYKKNDGKYQFYRFDESRIPLVHTYNRCENYKPRPNQKHAIEKFKEAIKGGRTNLLMYAVMRFGKSFTSMYCATEMKAKVVVIVSAKADVKEEWKKTIESHKRFKEYDFIDCKNLTESNTAIKDRLNEKKKVAIFLTLQDLQGKKVKERHKELFLTCIDLLIIDETHFGARGEKYGEVLRELDIKKTNNSEIEPKEKDTYYLDDLAKEVKRLHAKIRLHLSGTPYRILMGDEFKPEDIIAFYQFSDIIDEQTKWDKKNLNNDNVNEWDNPYYGFPQMVRFAFLPNASSRKKLEELKKSGITYAFSALFRPKSIKKDDEHQYHKVFCHETEILDLLEVIDGTKNEEGILGFLDYDRIKDGKMCRHIVCVLPFRASCDALEHLIITNKDKFKNLNSYEIINIASVDNEKKYPSTISIKEKIKSCERKNKRTLTLTVNRMLTGSTVEEWDTMIYLKDTASPQEYDQAIFRLQNQYIKTYKDKDGKSIRYNMKPQTLLVDFDPNRMFVMQENKSQIYNVNTDKKSNTQLEKRIRKELKISPIVTINNNKIIEVKPSNILDAVREYSKDKSVVDEATAIPIDFSLLDINVIRQEIEKQGKLGSKQGLKIPSTIGEGTNIDTTNNNDEKTPTNISKSTSTINDNEADELRKKFATYYSRILFFAFLTKDKIISLKELIEKTKNNENNKRIAKNLELDVAILKLIQEKINPFICRDLDYKIQNLNTLANDKKVEPIKRAEVAMKKFGRLSSSEIVTPEKVADEMVSILPQEDINKETKILDIASKQGEFLYAIYKKYGKSIANNVYSIPTSSIAYEFTRKVYELLNLDISRIERQHNSYHLIKEDNPMIKNDKIMINDKAQTFDIIIGNPPYQEMDGGAGASAKPIYNLFMEVAKYIKPSYISMIMPSRWFAGGKGLDGFRKVMLSDKRIRCIYDFINAKDCFPTASIGGGINYLLWDKEHNDDCTITSINGKERNSEKRPLNQFGVFIRYNSAIHIVGKCQSEDNLSSLINARNPFGLASSVRGSQRGELRLISSEGISWIPKTMVKESNPLLSKYKILLSKATAEHAGEPDKNGQFRILSRTEIIGPNDVCTDSYLIAGASDEKYIVENEYKYLCTRFARFLLMLAVSSINLSSEKFQFIPLQDFTDKSDIDWNESIADIDKQLYNKYALSKEEQDFIEKMIKPM